MGGDQYQCEEGATPLTQRHSRRRVFDEDDKIFSTSTAFYSSSEKTTICYVSGVGNLFHILGLHRIKRL